MEEKIKRAISEKICVEIEYDGGKRVIEPHCYGLSRAGNPVVRAYQSSGISSSGSSVAWKLFEISQIVSLTLLDHSFKTRDGYRKGDKGMSEIICEI